MKMEIADLDFQKDWVLPEFKDKITTLERDSYRFPAHSTKIWLPLVGLGGVTELVVDTKPLKKEGCRFLPSFLRRA